MCRKPSKAEEATYKMHLRLLLQEGSVSGLGVSVLSRLRLRVEGYRVLGFRAVGFRSRG